MKRIALGIDIRERKFLRNYNQIFSALEDAGYKFEIIFLEADDEILQRRYSQTRRIHPAAPSEHQLLQAINFEREQLRALRSRATRIIDTGTLSVHELKRLITRSYSYAGQNEQLSVQILSFGYKYGVPLEADLVMDVRFLPNPYFVESLKNLDGSLGCRSLVGIAMDRRAGVYIRLLRPASETSARLYPGREAVSYNGLRMHRRQTPLGCHC